MLLLTLLFSLGGPAMGEYSDFGGWSNAAESAVRNLASQTAYKTIYNTWYGTVGHKITPYLSQ
jgi:hypothetical protein